MQPPVIRLGSGYIAADIALTGAGAPKLHSDVQGALELDADSPQLVGTVR